MNNSLNYIDMNSYTLNYIFEKFGPEIEATFKTMTLEEIAYTLGIETVSTDYTLPKPPFNQATKKRVEKDIADIIYDQRKQLLVKHYAKANDICPVLLEFEVDLEILRKKEAEKLAEKRKKDAIMARMKAHKKP